MQEIFISFLEQIKLKHILGIKNIFYLIYFYKFLKNNKQLSRNLDKQKIYATITKHELINFSNKYYLIFQQKERMLCKVIYFTYFYYVSKIL